MHADEKKGVCTFFLSHALGYFSVYSEFFFIKKDSFKKLKFS